MASFASWEESTMIDLGSRSSSPEHNYDVDISPRSNDLYKHHHVFQPARRHSANIMLDLIHLKEDEDADDSDIVSVSDPSSAAAQQLEPPLSPFTIDISEPSSSTSPTFSVNHSPSSTFSSRPGSQFPDPLTTTSRPNNRFHELDGEIFNWINVSDPRLHLDNGLDNRSGESFARKVQADPHLYISPRRNESIASFIRRLVAKWLALMKLGKLKRR